MMTKVCLAFALLLGASAHSLFAQAQEGPSIVVGSATQTNLDTSQLSVGNARVPLFRGRDGGVALGVIAIAAATMPIDESVARSLQRPSVQSNRALRGMANAFSNLGFPGSAILSAGEYFLGLQQHSRPIAALGMHTGEAIVLGGVLAEGLQMTIGRSRPQRDINEPRDFRLGKGFSNDDYTSLPSAHVTVAFAAATATSRDVNRSWPAAARYVTPISYSAALLVGFARMYKNKHWASDVVAASGLGTYSAVLFDRYNEGHPDNIFERVFLPTSIVPERRGIAIGWSPTR
jgi:membrane-associated phospholipid phosphatase